MDSYSGENQKTVYRFAVENSLKSGDESEE
jgi:hypothetical protein